MDDDAVCPRCHQGAYLEPVRLGQRLGSAIGGAVGLFIGLYPATGTPLMPLFSTENDSIFPCHSRAISGLFAGLAAGSQIGTNIDLHIIRLHRCHFCNKILAL